MIFTNKQKIISAASLFFLFSTQSNAAMIAQHQYAINKTDAVIVSLSNLQRGEAEKSDAICEKQGKRMVLLLATSSPIYPQTIPYASGCWYYQSGIVYVNAKTIKDGIEINQKYNASEFKTTNEFTKWKDYYLVSRNSKKIQYPPPGEDECKEIIKTHGFLSRGQFECGFKKYSSEMLNEAKICSEIIKGKEQESILRKGMELFDENLKIRGKEKLCMDMKKDFPNIYGE